MGLADDQKFRDGMEAILNEIAAETPAPEFRAAAENLIQTVDRFIAEPSDETTQHIKADYTALYSISGTPGEALLHKMMNLVKTGQDGHFTLNDHIERKNKDDEAYSRQFKTALQAIIAQENAAEASRQFNKALEAANREIPKILGDAPRDIMKWEIDVHQKSIGFKKQAIQDLTTVHTALEAVEQNPQNPAAIEAAKGAIDTTLQNLEQHKTECKKQLKKAEEYESVIREKAENIIPILREVAAPLPEGKFKELVKLDLKSLSRWVAEDGRGQAQYDNQHIKKAEEYLQENYENIPPEERRMYEAYLRTNSSLTDPLLKLYGTRELIIQNLQIIDKIRQDLQQIKEALEELEKTPAEARQADFSAQKEQLMQKKNELETSLDTEEALVRRLQKTFEQSNNEVDRKLQSTIDRLNADYQKEGALEGTSWLMDKVSGIWETSIKGNAYQFMGYDEKDLRYRYEVPDPNNPGKTILHPVFLAIENKLYYYLDAEGKRVLLPAPEQRRLREADQNDALSRRVENINETLSDVKNVGRNLLNGEFSKAAKKGIEALDSLPAIVFDKTASEIASDAVDLASDAASSLYNEALSIFAPTEDTPAATNKFEKAAGTAPVPTSQPIPAPTNTGPGSP